MNLSVDSTTVETNPQQQQQPSRQNLNLLLMHQMYQPLVSGNDSQNIFSSVYKIFYWSIPHADQRSSLLWLSNHCKNKQWNHKTQIADCSDQSLNQIKGVSKIFLPFCRIQHLTLDNFSGHSAICFNLIDFHYSCRDQRSERPSPSIVQVQIKSVG